MGVRRSIGELMYRAFAFLMIALCAMCAGAKPFVVVIDAGHGGKDYGALGEKVNEKTVNLNVALKLGKLIEDKIDDVKVVYTRKDDRFLTLQQRADVANRAEGDLFISIHTNSVDKSSRNRTTVNGSATYTLGMHKTAENLAVAKRENSVIKLEKDYSTTYQGFDPNSTESYIIFEINQSKHVEQSVDFAQRVQREFSRVAGRKNNGVRQAGFWVLAKTSMPAVLVELEFICNPTIEKYIGSDDGQDKLAESIFNAFKSYHKSYYSSLKSANKQDGKKKKKDASLRDNGEEKDAEVANKDDKSPKQDYDNVPKDVTEYRVQFLTSPRKLKDNDKSLRDVEQVNYYYENGIYKYTSGSVTDKKEALSLQNRLRKKFPQAFIVSFKNGKRIK